MSGEGLVELARRYVRCSDELASLRDQIKRAVLNGGGDPPNVPFSKPARASGGSNQKAIAAAEAEQRILALLKDRPSLRTTEVAKATGAKTPTVVERLRRLQAKGLIEREDASGGWTVSAAP
jgi:hypothetical protein